MVHKIVKARDLWRTLEAFRAYNVSKDLSPKTLQTYEEALGRFYAWFVERHGEEADITPQRVREFAADRLQGGKKGLTVRTELTALRAIFSYLVYDSILPEDDNPMRRVRNPREELPEIMPLTGKEIYRLLRSFGTDDPLERRNYMICLLILDTGLRVGEVARLKVDDVDLGRLRIEVMGKGRKRRAVYVGRKTAQALADYLEECRPEICNGHHTLFPPTTRSTSATMQPHYLSEIIRKKMDGAGIARSYSSGHRLRHTFAANFVKAGGNVFALQRLLGHSKLDMTRRYVMLLEEDLAEAHRKASPVDRMNL